MAIRTASPQEVQAAIASGRPVDLIDVRSASEYAAEHAVGARHVPLSTLDPAAVMRGRTGAAGDPVYIICRSGARSAAACGAFIDAGFPDVRSVSGGTSAWAAAGLPIARQAGGGGPPGMVRQIAIMTVVAAAILFVMPCSPLSVWGSAWCPVQASESPAPSSSPAPAQAAADGLDFARDVVAASAAKPVLVDFNATWCGPCTLLAPELEAAVSARGGAVVLVPIDVDRHGGIATAQKVEGIPDVRLWRGGAEVARFVGYKSRADITAWLDQALAK